MEIAETATKRAEPSSFGQREKSTARDVTLRVETYPHHTDRQPEAMSPADRYDDKELIRKLAACALFRDYQHAFGEATGLPLALRSAEDWQLAHASDRHQNSFCALVARNNHSCAGCLQMQQRVCNTANGVPATLKCSFGLNETAVTVKLGERTIGYLHTGQVFFNKPTSAQAAGMVNRLKKLDADVNPKDAVAAYEATRVVRRQTYDSVIRLLEFFARQLTLMANQIILSEQTTELPQVTKARQFIHDHCDEELSLEMVAQHAAISSFYLCKKFKEATGLNFTDYVARVRIEKARELLRNPNHRVSEVAFQTGFQSLSHFNRCFKRITGESPTTCRQQFRSV